MQWVHLLDTIRARKIQLARIEPRSPMPVLPPDGASRAAIDAVERKLGCPLPPSYRELLSMHDGVPELYQGASLLDTQHLARGTFVGLTRFVTDFGDITRALGAPSRRAPLFPFGIDAAAETIFAWDLSAPRADGEIEVVVWMNEIGARVESFPSLLELIIAMLESDVEDRLRALPPSSRRRSVYGAPIFSDCHESGPVSAGVAPASSYAGFAA
jgi:hypothetical protein